MIGKVEHRRNRRRVVVNDDRDGLDLAPVGQRRLNRDRHKALIESPIGCLEADDTLTCFDRTRPEQIGADIVPRRTGEP